MKKFSIALMICFSIISTFSGCKKDEIAGQSFNCIVDNQYWEARELQPWDSRVWLQFFLTKDPKKAYINAVCAQGGTIFLVLEDGLPISQKTYYFNGDASYGQVNTADGAFITDLQRVGKVEITYWNQQDSIIQGNFEFEGYNSSKQTVKRVKNGKFSIAY